MKIYHCILKCFGFNIIDYNSLNDQNLKKALNESKNEIINKNSILKNWNDIEIFECPICLDYFEIIEECKHRKSDMCFLKKKNVKKPSTELIKKYEIDYR